MTEKFKSTRIFAVILIGAAGLYFSCAHSGSADSRAFADAEISAGKIESEKIRVSMPEVPLQPEADGEADGEKETAALALAYKDSISSIEIKNNEWALLLGDIWFFWQSGRLLPESKVNDGKSYRSHGFYNYPLKLPEKVIMPDEQQLERIKGFTQRRQTIPRDNTFLDTLYGGSSLSEIRSHIKNTQFLGFRFEAHEKIIPKLKEIEREIREAETRDIAITHFINSLSSIGGFNWRQIENSSSRSYHSYGIAVDLIPKNTAGKQIYWNWTSIHDEKWYAVPYEKRWMVPEQIIAVFEKYGFIWGGKWLYYDNMHFEYRPDLLILAGQQVY